jgi:predicted transposase YdaD
MQEEVRKMARSQVEQWKQEIIEARAAGTVEGEARGRAEGEARGRAEGKAEGKAELVGHMAQRRLGVPPPAAVEWLARSRSSAEWDAVAEVLLKVESWAELLALA